ncbi:MAG: LysM peptidoglycan-binding domain-containing protein [Chitinophagaceae bacterium]
MKKFFILNVLIALSCLCYAQTTELMVNKAEKGLYVEHTIAPKEGLYYIGRLYNVNAKSIAAYNHTELNKSLEIGQVLRIPLSDTNFTQKSTSGTPVYYKVMSGDGLYKVSGDNNKVPLKNIRDWNNLTSDNIQEGSNLVIGFLIAKEMPGYLANNRLKKQELLKLQQAEAEKAAALKQDSLNSTVAIAPIEDKTVTKQEKPIVKEDKPVVKTEPVTAPKQAVMDVSPDVKKEEIKTTPAVVKEEAKAVLIEDGYFKISYEQQVKAKPASKSTTVTSGIFKTTSGWQDAKYYLLMDGVTPGTIIRIVNPDNNRAVYAKVLGEMNGIRQNQGLDIRISNAAAAALAVREDDKFVVKVSY